MWQRGAFFQGVRTISPVILGVIPFGMISGVAAVEIGLSGLEAQAMAVIVFAGASQLAGVQLISSGSPLLVIWLTTLMINLRFTMYSASLAPHFRPLSLFWKSFLAYALTDQAYAASLNRYQQEDPAALSLGHKVGFYLGVAATIWTTWQISSAVGIFLGASVPDSWSLDFAVPLVFMVLAVPAIRSSATAIAACTAGLTAVIAKPLPFNLGLVLAALLGITVGVVMERRHQRRSV
jgi:4-azaleucine resistance transporter AzlC